MDFFESVIYMDRFDLMVISIGSKVPHSIRVFLQANTPSHMYFRAA